MHIHITEILKKEVGGYGCIFETLNETQLA
jgi:hypothetical protein